MPAARHRRGEEAFTLIEMVIVLLLSSIVLTAAVSSLTSLANAAGRNDSVESQEQTVSTVMAQLERDVRSASSISFLSGASPADELQLAVFNGGSTTNVLWVYDPTAATLTRETQVNGAFQPSGSSLTGVSSGAFTYYGSGAQPLSAPAGSIALCATAVAIDLKVTSTQAGVGSFEETAEVALTGQTENLTAPGDGLCGSMPEGGPG